MDEFVGWTVETLRDGISLLIVDLFRPGAFDPQGIHKAIWDEFIDNGFVSPADKPLTLASYLAKPYVEAFVEPCATGGDMVNMPLFLDASSYIEVPLTTSYRKTFNMEPKHLRERLTG